MVKNQSGCGTERSFQTKMHNKGKGPGMEMRLTCSRDRKKPTWKKKKWSTVKYMLVVKDGVRESG